MPTVKSRFVSYTDEEMYVAKCLGTAVALLWSSLPEAMRVLVVEQALMLEPSLPDDAGQRAAINAFIEEKSAEGMQ